MSLASPEISQSSLAPARSQEEIRAYLLESLSKSLNTEPDAIDTTASVDRLGVDSLMALGLAGALATWLGRDIPATLTWDYRSIDAISLALATAPTARPLPPGIVALQPRGDAIPIFGFPGLAGTPLAFAALASKLPETVPFYGVAVPGFDGVSAPLTTIEEISAAMLAMIRQVRPKGPYRFAGYCFGGLLAYEAARQLTAAGEQVSLLATYDTFTPTGRVPKPTLQRMLVHLYLLATGERHLRDLPRKLRFSHLSRLFAKPKPKYWVDPAKEFNTPRDLWSINARSSAKYRPGKYHGPLIWFQPAERGKYNAFFKMQPDGGWSQCTTGPVTVVTIPGDHGNLIGPEHAKSAAEALCPFLSQ